MVEYNNTTLPIIVVLEIQTVNAPFPILQADCYDHTCKYDFLFHIQKNKFWVAHFEYTHPILYSNMTNVFDERMLF